MLLGHITGKYEIYFEYNEKYIKLDFIYLKIIIFVTLQI